MVWTTRERPVVGPTTSRFSDKATAKQRISWKPAKIEARYLAFVVIVMFNLMKQGAQSDSCEVKAALPTACGYKCQAHILPFSSVRGRHPGFSEIFCPLAIERLLAKP